MFDLGEQYLAGLLIDCGNPAKTDSPTPLELIRCDISRRADSCGLVQLRHTVVPEKLYSEYYYQSGINHTMRDNLAGIVNQAESLLSLQTGDLVLDIGCNDGSLLESYTAPGLEKLGIDPSDVALQAVDRGFRVIRSFFSFEAFHSMYASRKAKVITSIAMFYDLPDPNRFVADIKKVLDESGIWILEQSYLPSMLAQNAFDTICHEHLEYYSLAVLRRLIQQHGLEIITASLNDINGGSIRLVVGHKGVKTTPKSTENQLRELDAREQEMKLDDDRVYAGFRDSARQIKSDLLEVLNKAKAEGVIVHGYGASTKGNTILQYCGIDSRLVSAIADRNPRKWGKCTIGTNIKIISEQESREQRPGFYLVLPWHFMGEFRRRETGFLARGGKFIVPMPKVHLVGT